jgi:hypothetical protein
VSIALLMCDSYHVVFSHQRASQVTVTPEVLAGTLMAKKCQT